MGHNDHMMTEDDLAGICIEAGALKVCPAHPHVVVNQGDPEAERRAYAIATNRWKAGGLIEDRPDVMEGIKHALEMAADECPECERLRDA